MKTRKVILAMLGILVGLVLGTFCIRTIMRGSAEIGYRAGYEQCAQDMVRLFKNIAIEGEILTAQEANRRMTGPGEED